MAKPPTMEGKQFVNNNDSTFIEADEKQAKKRGRLRNDIQCLSDFECLVQVTSSLLRRPTLPFVDCRRSKKDKRYMRPRRRPLESVQGKGIPHRRGHVENLSGARCKREPSPWIPPVPESPNADGHTASFAGNALQRQAGGRDCNYGAHPKRDDTWILEWSAQ